MYRVVSLFIAQFALSAAAHAAWPDHPLQMIVQFPPGTTTDTVARDLAAKLGAELKQPVVVVNRPGAGGMIGVGAIANAKPDGYTIGTVNLPTLAIIPHLQKVPYEPLTAFDHLAVVGPYDYGIFVAADAPWKSLQDLVDYGRKNPGALTYGTLSAGTTNQLTMQRLGQDLKLDWVFVPYKGDNESVPALIGGQIQLINASPATALPLVLSGKLRMLAATSPQRWAALPDVPTLKETGLVDYSQNSFLSVAAPAGLDPEVRQRLEAALKKILVDPAVKSAYQGKFGQMVAYQSGEAYAKLAKDEFAVWGEILKDANTK
ncbi:tripartite tricarboxylate transporter substrate binding protein [Achromobacter deleyi]|uniref:tripartite tricarboxylate transporter substrate binding protein n=1 Tax=Achromobacter deleyi TaxID=1353891 RepID=UPI001490BDBD|nr:tripartite tricarboxylate transporter substrate binding protein [Achromobacter deleyi]QVQ24476.1 tripartite tricarboxylate transporter substrate binding protein [Achromobacter deleyi]UIP20008.1 tripartite tricarboxylate transporter substrate binding protein [Achromobacter deleyi]